MADTIEGADWSHWQGNPNVKIFKTAGGDFAYVKLWQGDNFLDDCAIENGQALKSEGVPFGWYGFLTTAPPSTQIAWGKKCIAEAPVKADLAVALDYEYYNQMTLEPYVAMNYGDFRFPYGANRFSVYLWALELGLVIPSSATLYTVATAFKNFGGHPVPALYLNPSTANAKCVNSTTYNWSQFLLWIANWNVTAPVIPTAWKGQPYYVWQDKVIQDARSWGVDGAMDHDIWGSKLPFPGVTPPSDKVSAEIFIRELNKSYKLLEV